MADDERRKDRPVLTGLLALVSVAVVVGLLGGLIATVAAQGLGFGEASSTIEPTEGGDTLYLPEPSRTAEPTGPLVSISPVETPTTAGSSDGEEKKKPKKKEEKRISLSVGDATVSPMERIDLTGIYPGGEGAILEVQRFEDGRWVDFYSVSANVANETFSTYVETGRVGVNRFRVVDPDTGRASNQVKVTVG